MNKFCLLLLLMTTLSGQAATLRCEALFVSVDELEKAAEKLISFRIETAEIKDQSEKFLRLKEFPQMYQLFLQKSMDPELAQTIYAKTDSEVRRRLKHALQITREQERKVIQARNDEQDLVQRWSQVGKKTVSEYAIDKIITTPDSSKVFVVTGGYGHLYDAKTMEEIKLPFGLDEVLDGIKDASFSADGQKLIVYGDRLRVFDLKVLVEDLNIDLTPYFPANFPHQVVLSPDRTRFVVAGYNWYAVYNVKPKKLIFKSPEMMQMRNIKPKFSADSTRLILEGGDLLVHDLTKKEITSVLDPDVFENSIFSVDDGQHLTVYTSRGSRRVLDFKSGTVTAKSIFKWPANKEPKVFAVPQRHQIVFVDSNQTTVLDLKTDQKRNYKTPKSFYPEAIGLSVDGEYLIMPDKHGLKMKIFNLDRGEEVFTNPVEIDSPHQAVFTADGARCFVGSSFGEIFVWFHKSSDAAHMKSED